MKFKFLSLAAPAAASFLACALPAVGADKGAENLFISPCGEPFPSIGNEAYGVVTWFNRVDANHDGKIDKAEFTADAEAFFKRLDRNGDGTLTSDEIFIYEHQIVPEILHAGQASIHSGIIRASYQITPDEVTSNPDAQVNYDHDGSKAEQQSEEAAQERAQALRAFNEGAAFFGLFGDPEPVTAADRNFDFKISHKEFMDQSDRHFARLDVKGQGYFILADVPRTPAEILVNAKRVASR